MINTVSGNQEVLLELKKMSKLLAIIATEGKSQSDKILLFSQVGLPPKEIAEILGITPNLVSVTMHQNKKKGKKKS
jgi:DNA-binding CsgD family transcriptional regulator